MSETAIGTLTAADLTPEHYGLLVSWEVTTEYGTVLREAVCEELRRWVYKGQRRVEIIDFTPNGPWVGEAHTLDGNTRVGVGRRINKPRRRRWLKEPLAEWADLETHDPRCISLTDSEFNDACDCKTLLLIDANAAAPSDPKEDR